MVLLLFVGKANGSSDRLVADMDDQSRQVEEGIASALCHSLPLLNVVIRDAAAQTTRPVRCYFSFLSFPSFPSFSLFSLFFSLLSFLVSRFSLLVSFLLILFAAAACT